LPIWPGGPITAHWASPIRRPSMVTNRRSAPFRAAALELKHRIGGAVAALSSLDGGATGRRLVTSVDAESRQRHPRAAAPAYDLPRRVAAEALGTALLLAVVVGSGIMGERLAAGNAAMPARQHARDRRRAVRADRSARRSGAHLNPRSAS
jgi:hypothetical protein